MLFIIYLLIFLLQTEDVIWPYVAALSEFRDNVRNTCLARTPKGRPLTHFLSLFFLTREITPHSLETDSKGTDTELLDLCGTMRDDILPTLGVRLEDRGAGEKAVVKLVDRDLLMKERMQAVEVHRFPLLFFFLFSYFK